MADNVQIVEKASAGTGEAAFPIAADDVAGVMYQRMKLDVGADGASRPVTDAAPLPVALSGTLPATGDAATTGTLAAPDAAVTLTAGGGQSAYAVQVEGAFTGSLVIEVWAGLRWDPVAFRQSGGGPFLSRITAPGSFRGNLAGFSQVRVRAVTLTAGTPNVAIRASQGTGSVFTASLLTVQSPEQFYASVAGGTVLFGATTGHREVASGGGPIALLYNPADSGVDVFFAVGNWGNVAAGRFQRYTVTAATVAAVATGAQRPIRNRGGGSNTAKAQFYAAGSLTFTPPADDSAVGQVLYVPANGNYDGAHSGSLVIRPGVGLLWYFFASSNAATQVAISMRWWELPAQGA